jgi:thioredoxin reductase
VTPQQAEVVIVGAGPAGLAAAIELRRLGVGNVTVVDREAQPGGVPRLCHHTGFGLKDLHQLRGGPGYAAHYVRRAEAADVDICTSTTITGWQGANKLTYTSPGGLGAIEAKAILLATGCRERPRAARLVPGSRPQGVYTTGSLQRFVYEQHLPVGHRAVIVGAEIVSLSALLTLLHAGVSVTAMITHLPHHQIYFPYLPAKWALADVWTRTPIITSARLARILGRGRVEAVEIAHQPSGRLQTIACDAVIFTGDWIPEHEVARLGGLALDAGTRGPRVDAAFRASTRGVFAAGNLLHGAEIADVCALEGRRAARHVVNFLEDGIWPESPARIVVEPPLAWVFPNAISLPVAPSTASEFIFQVREFCWDVEVTVSQGERLLHAERYRRLGPNASAHLDGRWLPAVRPGDEALRVAVRA